MGKFSNRAAKKPLKGVSKQAPTTTNLAGGEAYALSTKAELASLVLSSMIKSSFYQSEEAALQAVVSAAERAVAEGQAEYVAKLALYARYKHGLRSVTHVLGGIIGAARGDYPWKRAFFRNLVYRPDDILETLGFWNSKHEGQRHPNAMLRGFADVLAKLSPHALAKYKGEGRSVSMIDAVNICHPKAKADSPIHLLMKGTLPAAETWETALSKAGNAGDDADVIEAKGAAWTKLLVEKKLGYLACLRNLRNILEQAPEAVDMALALITDPEAIAKSKVFPFQFRTAYDEISDRKTRAAIVRAADTAMSNVPVFNGRTLVVVDDSKSMRGQPIKLASLFAAVLMKANHGADYMQFASSARYMDLDAVGLGTFALAESIERSVAGGSTAFAPIFNTARKGYDRIIILSDMQGWMEGGCQPAFASYARASGKVPYLYSFNLQAQGTAMFPEKQVCLLSGFSEKIFDTMAQCERDPAALVHEIESVDVVAGIKR